MYVFWPWLGLSIVWWHDSYPQFLEPLGRNPAHQGGWLRDADVTGSGASNCREDAGDAGAMRPKLKGPWDSQPEWDAVFGKCGGENAEN
jgi:hypothetical protein